MPLGTEVGLGSGHVVLDGYPAPPSKREGAQQPPTNFRPMSIVAKRLDGSRCHFVTWAVLLVGGGGAGSPYNTVWPWPMPTSVPNDILIHPAVWLQQT